MGIRDYSLQNILFVHNFIAMFLIFVFILVFFYFIFVVTSYSLENSKINYLVNQKSVVFKVLNLKYYFNKYIFWYLNRSHNIQLEIVWTIFPILIILELIFPSLSLASSDEIDLDSSLYSVSVLGNQWYWDYEFHTGTKTTNISSNLIKEEDTLRSNGLVRLLATTKSLIIPAGVKMGFYITSNDVIHSWAIPSLGVKVDAIPGRLNVKNFVATRVGVYSGMCSELCGIDHGFMPITVSSLLYPNFMYLTSDTLILKEQQWSQIN